MFCISFFILLLQEFDTQKEIIRETGMTGPLCWYKAAVSSIDMEDCKSQYI